MKMAIIDHTEEATWEVKRLMSKLVAGTMLAIPLDGSSHVPLFRQLYDHIRDGIFGGRIPPGGRLPSSRTLAADLAVSRTTILSAFDQLVAEGYLEGKVGSGMRVVSTLPDTTMIAAPRAPLPKHAERDDKPVVASRTTALAVACTARQAPRGAPASTCQSGSHRFSTEHLVTLDRQALAQCSTLPPRVWRPDGL